MERKKRKNCWSRKPLQKALYLANWFASSRNPAKFRKNFAFWLNFLNI